MSAPRRKARADQRGVALIMVLGAIAVLSVLLADFQDETSSELAAAVSDRDALKAEYLAKSGVNLSRLLIAAEPTMRQSLGFILMMFGAGAQPPQVPIWDFSDRILGAFNDTEGSAEFAALTNTDPTQGKNLGIEGGRFDVVIVDEDSKLNFNLAARGDQITELRMATELLSLMGAETNNPLFEQRDRDDQFTDRQTLCSAIIDWADFDESQFSCDLRPNAAQQSTATEDSFYQMLKVPYRRKNAAYDSLEELHLVRGIGDDFWSTFIDPEPENPRKRVVTVWGQGAVNVNTANAQTLWAIACAGANNTPGAPPPPPARSTAPNPLGGAAPAPNPTGATFCTDPVEAQKFVMAVTLLRGFTAGAPLFATPTDFIKTMKGQGKLGPLLSALQISPISFKSDAETAKTISTESKVFSIYADGLVPGYQRKTKVRLHVVVDFRSAPPPGMAPLPGAPPVGSGAPPAAPPGTVPGQTNPTTGVTGQAAAGLSPDAISGALLPNPGGTIIYYRVD